MQCDINDRSISIEERDAAFQWLRDNDPTSIDPVTRERVFDISGLEGDPLPEEARMEENTLVIRWKGEPLESRFPLDWLDAWGETAAPRDPADARVHHMRAAVRARATAESSRSSRRVGACCIERERVASVWSIGGERRQIGVFRGLCAPAS